MEATKALCPCRGARSSRPDRGTHGQHFYQGPKTPAPPRALARGRWPARTACCCTLAGSPGPASWPGRPPARRPRHAAAATPRRRRSRLPRPTARWPGCPGSRGTSAPRSAPAAAPSASARGAAQCSASDRLLHYFRVCRPSFALLGTATALRACEELMQRSVLPCKLSII